MTLGRTRKVRATRGVMRRVRECHPPDGPDDLLSYIAELEADVERSRRLLEGQNEREGERCCTGCGGLIRSGDDEAEHDFCPYPEELDDDEPTEPMLERTTGTDFRPLCYQGEVQCPCQRRHGYELVAPAGTVSSVAILLCSCGTRLDVSYSWVRGCVTGVRIERTLHRLN